MGKGKDKKKGRGRKEDAVLKIPKPLRKAGKEALKLAGQPVVSEVVAAALLSAAAALRNSETAAKAGRKAAEKAAEAAEGASEEALKIGDALRGLALDLARRTLDNWDRPAPAAAGKTGNGASRKTRAGG
ncbi:MAG TPA: hypothetical protein VFW19_18220 [Allosphingosinicella sp.]|nr:hypothetical protein [Allosphingosinicella sp.]